MRPFLPDALFLAKSVKLTTFKRFELEQNTLWPKCYKNLLKKKVLKSSEIRINGADAHQFQTELGS